MNIFKSIKFQVWLRFELVVAILLLFAYVFLIEMFPTFYEWMKTYEISEAVITIRSNWYNAELADIIDSTALKNKMYISVIAVDYENSRYYTHEKNEMPGSGSLLFLSKEGYMAEVKKSGTGTVYRRFKEERENNTVLMLVTGVGDNKEYPDGYICICNYIQPIGTTMSIFRRQYFFVSVITLIITLFISALFASKITYPIIRINTSAKELPHGKFEAKIGERDYAEIKQLAGTLKSASKEIAKSENLQRELMANISHDLRTPLTMIFREIIPISASGI